MRSTASGHGSPSTTGPTVASVEPGSPREARLSGCPKNAPRRRCTRELVATQLPC